MLHIFKKKEIADDAPYELEALAECQENESETFEEVVESATAEPEDQAEETPSEETPTEATPVGFTDEFEENSKAYAAGRNVPEGELKAALQWIRDIGEGWNNGDLTTEMLEICLNGVCYRQDLEDARLEGEIAGRNTRIEELYITPEESDGLPHFASKGNIGNASGNLSSIFDLARSSR